MFALLGAMNSKCLDRVLSSVDTVGCHHRECFSGTKSQKRKHRGRFISYGVPSASFCAVMASMSGRACFGCFALFRPNRTDRRQADIHLASAIELNQNVNVSVSTVIAVIYALHVGAALT